MARTIICPHCQMKGTLPDGAKAAKIRCPKCGETFSTAPTRSGNSSTIPREASGPNPIIPKVAKQTSGPNPTAPKSATQKSGPNPTVPKTALQKSGPNPIVPKATPATITGASPAEVVETSATGRSVATAGASRAMAGVKVTNGPNPMILFALFGTSGFAVFLLGVIVLMFLREDPDAAETGPEEKSRASVTSAPVDNPEPRTAAVASRISTPVPTPDTTTPAVTPVAAAATEVAPAPVAEDAQAIVRRLKDATVYLKIKVNGKTVSSGTGFVIEVNGDTVWLATNRHVAVLDPSELPRSIAPEGAKAEIEAIFRSGQGQKSEQALPATIIAADLSEDINADLAFLQVKGVREPPVPLDVQKRIEPSEGLHYIGAGFPLGGILSNVIESKSNPSVTITGGRVAALRKDDSGQLSIIQVDGSLQPGNSGGPIIDERSGQLLGVAVAKVGSVDTIGFIVPADELRRALNGRVGAVDLTLNQSPQGTADLQVKAQVVDPRKNIKGVSIHIVPAVGNPMPSPLPDGSWPSVTKSKEVELAHDANLAVASGQLKVQVGKDGPDARKVLIQTAWSNQGKMVYSKPRELILPDKPGRIRPPGQLERVLKVVRRKSINLLGPLLENSKDCQLIKDESSLKIRIDVPGKLHTLSPLAANNRNIPVHNAPITLTDVEGDFAVLVDVGGDVDPGTTAPKDPRGNKIPITVQSAGLILYQDKENFLRLERAVSVETRTLSPSNRLIMEFVRKGRFAVPPIFRDIPDTKTLLILVKRKGRIRCLFSPDEGKTMFAFQEFAADLPSKVRVGLTAGNVSVKPYAAEFENFALISDATKIDQEFGE